ncbi:site-specific integrase [Archaeoglobales archaeon]|nr:MAG: site-specific integrase [Archaeoglobales archaeon]
MRKAPACPECGSRKVWKDGLRYLSDGSTVQRYICRECGYRFSDPCKSLRRFGAKTCISNACQERALLAEVAKAEKRAAGATIKQAESWIINLAWFLKRQGYADYTINRKIGLLKTLRKKGADLNDPDSVFLTIASQNWSNGTKRNAVNAYANYAECFGIPIKQLPKYRYEQPLPWIPLETEIDQLIAGCSHKIATFLQTIKETMGRSCEIARLKWEDIDFERNIIILNNPAKNGLPRMFKISDKLVSMLKRLPRKSEYVFGENALTYIRKNFHSQRKRIAHKLGNPRLLKIGFHTIRHWAASMLYHQTKDILLVKERLGHKNITSTMIYTHLINFESNEFIVKTASTLEEDEELIKAGFEYVTERNGIKIYRKRK